MKKLPHTYFRHDLTASMDSRMLLLRAKHGYEGCGVYWHIVETLYLNEGRMEADAIRSLFGGNKIVDYCISLGLFLVDSGGVLTSERIDQELNYRTERSKKAKVSIMKRWGKKAKKRSNTNVLSTNYERDTNVILGEDRIEEDITTYSGDLICARLLSESIRKTNPAYRQKYPADDARKISKWADDFRKLREIDHATEDQIKLVIQWIFESDSRDANFWKPNIQSGSTLRDKFQRIVGQMQRVPSAAKPHVHIS